MPGHTWTHCVSHTGPDNVRTDTTIPGTHSDDVELSHIGQDIRLMYCRMPDEITLFTLINIQYISDSGEVSDTLEVRLGELPRLISDATASGRMVLMTAEHHDQTDILEFLERSE